MQTSRSFVGSTRIAASLADQPENTWSNRTNCQAGHVCSLITRAGRVRTPFRTSPRPRYIGSLRTGSGCNLRSRSPCPHTLVRVNRDLFRFFDWLHIDHPESLPFSRRSFIAARWEEEREKRKRWKITRKRCN